MSHVQKTDHVTDITPMVDYLVGNLQLLCGDIYHEEIHRSDVASLVRDIVNDYFSGTTLFFDNPIYEDYGHYSITKEQCEFLVNAIRNNLATITANTIRTIDPREYISVNWLSDERMYITQTTNGQYSQFLSESESAAGQELKRFV